MPSKTLNPELAAQTDNDNQLVAYTATFPKETPSDEEINLLEMLNLIAMHKRTVAKIIFCFTIGALVLAFVLPVYYTAETRILPPQQTQSIASSMLGQLAPLAGLAGKDLGLKNPSDVYVALLQSRTVADSLIQRFNLQDIYREKKLSATRERLADHSRISAGKDGIISVAVEDTSANRAASIANGYTDELYKLNQRLAITEASQRRLFFANELASAKEELAKAEMELKKTQEITGLIQLDTQAKAIIESMATVGAQIAAKEVQLRSMQSFATEQNPDYRRVQEELAALQSQLGKLQRSPYAGNGDIMVPTSKVPTAGLEYLRKLRDVKYYETIFEVLAKQYEIAKIDEAKTAPVVQVVDTAVEPDKRSRPQRLLIIGLGCALGILVSILSVFLRERYQRAMNDLDNQEKFRLLRSRLWSRYPQIS